MNIATDIALVVSLLGNAFLCLLVMSPTLVFVFNKRWFIWKEDLFRNMYDKYHMKGLTGTAWEALRDLGLKDEWEIYIKKRNAESKQETETSK